MNQPTTPHRCCSDLHDWPLVAHSWCRRRFLLAAVAAAGILVACWSRSPTLDPRFVGDWGIGSTKLASFEEDGRATFYGSRCRWYVIADRLYLHGESASIRFALHRITDRFRRTSAPAEVHEY